MPTEFQVLKFRKPLINEGSFVHPGTKRPFSFDRQRMSELLLNFKQMQSRGVKVPLTRVHDFDGDSANVLGYMNDLSIDDDGWLSGEFEIRGADSIKLAQTVDQVSVGLEKDFKDGLDNRYSEVIQHVAITPVPVIPGQGGFQIAASRDSQQFIVLHRGETNMLNKDEVSRISDLMGIELTQENAIDKIESKLKALASQGSPDLEKQLSASRNRVKELEGLTIPKIDKDTVEERAQFYGECFDSLSSKFTAPTIDGIKNLLIGPNDNRNCYAMSTNGGRDVALARAVYDLLKNEPDKVELGERTGPQSGTVALDSRGLDGNTFDKEIHNRMRAFAGLKGI